MHFVSTSRNQNGLSGLVSMCKLTPSTLIFFRSFLGEGRLAARDKGWIVFQGCEFLHYVAVVVLKQSSAT